VGCFFHNDCECFWLWQQKILLPVCIHIDINSLGPDDVSFKQKDTISCACFYTSLLEYVGIFVEPVVRRLLLFPFIIATYPEPRDNCYPCLPSKLMVENTIRFSQLTDFSDFGCMDVGCLVGLPSLEVIFQTRSCGTRPCLHAKRHPHGHLVNGRGIGKCHQGLQSKLGMVWSCSVREFRPKTRCHMIQGKFRKEKDKWGDSKHLASRILHIDYHKFT